MILGNITAEAERYVGFVPDPDGRGTVSLVLSCLLTLLLCVWQALHLNVPGRGESYWQCILSNGRWIIAGIYAPELVVFTAWRQWSSARILDAAVKQHYPSKISQPPSEKSKLGDCWTRDTERQSRRHRWTKTHSFFASTGGFAFEFENEHDGGSFPPRGCSRRLAITARGMELLARCGRLPDVSEEEILDKSKANGLAKALVMIQATWMLLQCIGRLFARLPVTLLEINTVAHVLCALLMYVMWWNKPLLAKEPIIIRGAWVPALAAYMFINSEMSGAVDKSALKSETAVKTLFASLHLYSKAPEVDSLVLRYSQDPDRRGLSFQTAPKECIQATEQCKLANSDETAFFERKPRVAAQAVPRTIVSEEYATAKRRRLAAQAYTEYQTTLENGVLLKHNTQGIPCIHLRPSELLTSRVQNWPGDDLLRNVGGLMVGMILWLSNLCYGGVHIAAWNEHFPSAAEMWMWRVSALYIGFCGGLWVVLNWVTMKCKPLNEFWERWMDGEKSWASNVGIGALVVGCGGALCVARCFIVVEAFVSIRSLPGSAYDTPSWTQVVPHF